MPEEEEEAGQDPQVLPIHFNYNFIERDQIPLHNDKFSRASEDYTRFSSHSAKAQQNPYDVVSKDFFDISLPAPSHVVLNHINSWETMGQLKNPPITTLPSTQEGELRSDDQPPKGGLTCVSMAQRLNRSKFVTIVYYKPASSKD
uniref:Association with the SNF1 complex (ASC) domain-containing protein n=1 Tax=Strombidium rassoulzadegani TaxID=1082188 RepID=A0A7S3CHP3_9SPIT|mmetsp:Transcript_1040/g.1898  ORF Transcript_1040/g.1898 Transcript_1040/m.1898 type:complete len:145 (+) Transcript_1040:1932-2366(+)